MSSAQNKLVISVEELHSISDFVVNVSSHHNFSNSFRRIKINFWKLVALRQLRLGPITHQNIQLSTSWYCKKTNYVVFKTQVLLRREHEVVDIGNVFKYLETVPRFKSLFKHSQTLPLPPQRRQHLFFNREGCLHVRVDFSQESVFVFAHLIAIHSDQLLFSFGEFLLCRLQMFIQQNNTLSKPLVDSNNVLLQQLRFQIKLKRECWVVLAFLVLRVQLKLLMILLFAFNARLVHLLKHFRLPSYNLSDVVALVDSLKRLRKYRSLDMLDVLTDSKHKRYF